MYKHLLPLLSRRNLGIAASTVACILGSFLIGIRSAGETASLIAPALQAGTFEASSASGAAAPGGNGILVLTLWILRSLIL